MFDVSKVNEDIIHGCKELNNPYNQDIKIKLLDSIGSWTVFKDDALMVYGISHCPFCGVKLWLDHKAN